MRMFVEPLISGLCSPRHCRKQYVCVFLVKQDLLVGHRCDSETHAIHERAIHERGVHERNANSSLSFCSDSTHTHTHKHNMSCD